MRVFRVPDGGWVVESDRLEAEPYSGFRLEEPAHRMVRLDASGRLRAPVSPQVWSDCEVLGCSVLEVRGTTLVDVVWSRIDDDVPKRSEWVIAEGLVEVLPAELPFRAEAEAALGEG